MPGCGSGHEVALAVEHGLDATERDIAPTGMAEARVTYPHLAERFVTGSLFDPSAKMRGAMTLCWSTPACALRNQHCARTPGLASISRCGRRAC